MRLTTFSSDELLGGQRGDDLAVAEHGHGVRDAEELLELVGDIDAGDAEGLQGMEDLHELVDFRLGEGRGGLVEDEHFRPSRRGPWRSRSSASGRRRGP